MAVPDHNARKRSARGAHLLVLFHKASHNCLPMVIMATLFSQVLTSNARG